MSPEGNRTDSRGCSVVRSINFDLGSSQKETILEIVGQEAAGSGDAHPAGHPVTLREELLCIVLCHHRLQDFIPNGGSTRSSQSMPRLLKIWDSRCVSGLDSTLNEMFTICKSATAKREHQAHAGHFHTLFWNKSFIVLHWKRSDLRM